MLNLEGHLEMWPCPRSREEHIDKSHYKLLLSLPLLPLSLNRVLFLSGLSPDHPCPLVVLLLQAHRVHGHLFLRPTEEQPSDHLPPHLPPCQHAQHLVVRHELGALRPLWVSQLAFTLQWRTSLRSPRPWRAGLNYSCHTNCQRAFCGSCHCSLNLFPSQPHNWFVFLLSLF